MRTGDATSWRVDAMRSVGIARIMQRRRTDRAQKARLGMDDAATDASGYPHGLTRWGDDATVPSGMTPSIDVAEFLDGGSR